MIQIEAIRLSKIDFSLVRNIREGSIRFDGAKNKSADIVALYGPNGTGKTTMVEILDVLRYYMSGLAIPQKYDALKTYWEDWMWMTAEFILQIKGMAPQKAKIYLKLTTDVQADTRELLGCPVPVMIENESLSVSLTKLGQPSRMQNVISDYKAELLPYNDAEKNEWWQEEYYCSIKKRKELFANPDDAIKKLASIHNQMELEHSMIFGDALANLLEEEGNPECVYPQIISALKKYALEQMVVLGSDFNNFDNDAFPIITNMGKRYLNLSEPQIISKEEKENIDVALNKANAIISVLQPNYKVFLRETDAEDSYELVVCSGAIGNACYETDALKMSDESTGIRKIIGIANALVQGFNDPSSLIIIDELDAHIFEVFLGQLLEVYQKYGKGQLLFTAHNLGPLEVLDRKCIWFTGGKGDAYRHCPSIGRTNNLRNLYLKNEGAEYYEKTDLEQICKAMEFNKK